MLEEGDVLTAQHRLWCFVLGLNNFIYTLA